jgi:hypothetical protein
MLKTIFDALERPCDKFEHYFPLYERHFSQFVGKAPKILEVGVQYGGSAEMWFKYFGAGTMVHGVDIAPHCQPTEYLELTVGDQGSEAFWETNFVAAGKRDYDIIIDDGSHDNPHQIVTLQQTFNLLKDGGIYWCEDTHTSYYHNVRVADGGYLNKKSFTEYSKQLIDVINSQHTQFAIGVGPTPNGPHVDAKLVALYRQTQAIHFYDSVVTIEKGPPVNFQRTIHTPARR